MNHYLLRMLFLSLSSVVVLSGCSEKQKLKEPVTKEKEYLTEADLITDYAYTEDLMVYLEDNFDKEIAFDQQDSLLFIPLNSCASCVNYTLKSLKINPYQGKIIVGGTRSEFPNLYDIIEGFQEVNSQVYIDSAFNMYSYRIDVGGPAFILKDENNWKIIELSAAKWPFINVILNWEAPEFDFRKGA